MLELHYSRPDPKAAPGYQRRRYPTPEDPIVKKVDGHEIRVNPKNSKFYVG